MRDLRELNGIDEASAEKIRFNASPRPAAKILKDVSEDAIGILQAEFGIFQNELKNLLPQAEKDMQRALLFITISTLSALPLLAFFVIGLGELLDQRYWLSSLIVSIVCYAVFKPLARKSYQKLTRENFHFNQTKQGLLQGLEAVRAKIKDVSDAATQATPQPTHTGEEYDNQVH